VAKSPASRPELGSVELNSGAREGGGSSPSAREPWGGPAGAEVWLEAWPSAIRICYFYPGRNRRLFQPLAGSPLGP
jgi:hypothetical protein